jgi:hypothetical protein
MSERCVSIVLCIFVLGALPVNAQTEASISGVMRRGHFRRLCNGTDPARSFVRTAIGNEASVYNFPVLQPGTYPVPIVEPYEIALDTPVLRHDSIR